MTGDITKIETREARIEGRDFMLIRAALKTPDGGWSVGEVLVDTTDGGNRVVAEQEVTVKPGSAPDRIKLSIRHKVGAEDRAASVDFDRGAVVDALRFITGESEEEEEEE